MKELHRRRFQNLSVVISGAVSVYKISSKKQFRFFFFISSCCILLSIKYLIPYI